MVRLGVIIGLWLLLAAVTHRLEVTAADSFWKVGDTGAKVSLRGLAAVENGMVIWACGSQATVVVSEDGGESWESVGPEGFEMLEFRSIAAFDRDNAIIASAGTPAVILKTTDGGKKWSEVVRRNESAAFFDALKFFDRDHGLAVSDPVDGKWLILRTKDGGESWSEISREALPPLHEGEAAFAASNSALAVAKDGSAWLGTGGLEAAESKIYRTKDYGESWDVSYCPIPSGKAAGVFSVHLAQDDVLVAVGGDYRPDTPVKHHAAFSLDRGKTWQVPTQGPRLFRSATVASVPSEQMTSQIWFAVGPQGSDYAVEVNNWRQASEVGFHALEILDKNRLVAVGSEGRYGIADISSLLKQ